MANKIALYAISKNEEKNLDHFIYNSKFFDHTLVLDTGSYDSTISVLRKHNINVIEKTYDPFNFSSARNDCLKNIPNDIEWCLWLDFNETVELNDEIINFVKNHKTATALYSRYFLYNEKENDFVEIEKKIKFHKVKNYIWFRPVHEELQSINSNDNIELTDIKFFKKSSNKDEKINLYYNLCYQEYKKGTNDLIYLRFLLDYTYEKKQWLSLYNFAVDFLNATEGKLNYFRPKVFRMISDYFLYLHQIDTARDFAFHSLSESLKYKASCDYWVRDAYDQLKKLGIEVNINERS